MNHKRGRAKNRRAGCLMCKPHKANGVKNRNLSNPHGARMGGLARTWKQEYRGHLRELEGREEADDPG